MSSHVITPEEIRDAPFLSWAPTFRNAMGDALRASLGDVGERLAAALAARRKLEPGADAQAAAGLADRPDVVAAVRETVRRIRILVPAEVSFDLSWRRAETPRGKGFGAAHRGLMAGATRARTLASLAKALAALPKEDRPGRDDLLEKFRVFFSPAFEADGTVDHLWFVRQMSSDLEPRAPEDEPAF